MPPAVTTAGGSVLAARSTGASEGPCAPSWRKGGMPAWTWDADTERRLRLVWSRPPLLRHDARLVASALPISLRAAVAGSASAWERLVGELLAEARRRPPSVPWAELLEHAIAWERCDRRSSPVHTAEPEELPWSDGPTL